MQNGDYTRYNWPLPLQNFDTGGVIFDALSWVNIQTPNTTQRVSMQNYDPLQLVDSDALSWVNIQTPNTTYRVSMQNSDTLHRVSSDAW